VIERASSSSIPRDDSQPCACVLDAREAELHPASHSTVVPKVAGVFARAVRPDACPPCLEDKQRDLLVDVCAKPSVLNDHRLVRRSHAAGYGNRRVTCGV